MGGAADGHAALGRTGSNAPPLLCRGNDRIVGALGLARVGPEPPVASPLPHLVTRTAFTVSSRLKVRLSLWFG